MRLEDLDYRLDEKNERNEESPPDAPCADSAIYRGVLGDLAHTAEPTTEADPVGIHCSLLSGTGVLIGPGPHVRIGNIRHPLLIWTLLLGRTGSGRKGEATAISELFMRQARPEFGDLTVGGLSSGEGLIERIRGKTRIGQAGPRRGRRKLRCRQRRQSTLERADRSTAGGDDDNGFGGHCAIMQCKKMPAKA